MLESPIRVQVAVISRPALSCGKAANYSGVNGSGVRSRPEPSPSLPLASAARARRLAVCVCHFEGSIVVEKEPLHLIYFE